MKVLVITDIHDQIKAAKLACEAERPDLVLDCGDRDELVNISGRVPHYYIRGNHEPSSVIFSGDDFLPNKIDPRQAYTFLGEGGDVITFSGIGGHYSPKDPYSAVSVKDVEFLKKLPSKKLDVLLVHESPFNDAVIRNPGSQDIAREIVHQIDRIHPRFVFAGHAGRYSEVRTPGNVPIYSLDDMGIGYGVINVQNGEMDFERRIKRFVGDKISKKRK